jgi:hypothetical protein
VAVKVMLAPNPNRSMAVDRVIIIGQAEEGRYVEVLNIDALGKDPKLMYPYGSGYSWATAVWNYIGVLVFLGGIALSFFWHWWAFIPGVGAAVVILKATRQGTADFAAKILAENKMARDHFTERGLIWHAPVQSVVPER